MTDRLTRWEGRDENGPRAVMIHREKPFHEAFQEILRKLARMEDEDERGRQIAATTDGGEQAQLYVKYDAGGVPIAYAYGEEWVAQALYMDDIRYKTPEEAMEAWQRENERRVDKRP